MTRRRIVITTLALLLALLLVMAAVAVVPASRQLLLDRIPTAWRIALAAIRYGIEVDHDVVIAMPDGVSLAASLYRPRGASGALPTVLVRLPYHRLRYGEGYNAALLFARHGYAVLVQDLRGSGDSGGELLPWQNAAEDGVVTLDWIVQQPWSNGKVGTYGCSALGETQFVLARRNHPAHAAMIPSGAGGAVGSAAGRYGYFGVYEGGVFQLASAFGWFVQSGSKRPDAAPAPPFSHAQVLRELPVADLVQRVRPVPSGYADFVNTPLSDPRWESWGYLSDADLSRVPALVINTWGDQTVADTLALAESWRRRGVEQKVIIGPGNHCQHRETGEVSDAFGVLKVENAQQPWQQWYLAWFDRWLRNSGPGLADLDSYTYFMLGENRWHSASSWPPADASLQRWYLSSAGRANTARGDGRLAPQPAATAHVDAYRYDPADPAPSRGGPVCCTGNPDDRAGPADQADVEARQDVLVYTSAALEADLRIAGPLRARLVFSSSAPDTDLVLRLVHVWPDGRATSIQEGALRLRYRNGVASPSFLEADRPVEATVDLRAIAYLIPRGHALRLQVTSSSFPRLERNLNTGAANNAQETRMVVATNRVHHGPAALSYLELPVLATGK